MATYYGTYTIYDKSGQVVSNTIGMNTDMIDSYIANNGYGSFSLNNLYSVSTDGRTLAPIDKSQYTVNPDGTFTVNNPTIQSKGGTTNAADAGIDTTQIASGTGPATSKGGIIPTGTTSTTPTTTDTGATGGLNDYSTNPYSLPTSPTSNYSTSNPYQQQLQRLNNTLSSLQKQQQLNNQATANQAAATSQLYQQYVAQYARSVLAQYNQQADLMERNAGVLTQNLENAKIYSNDVLTNTISQGYQTLGNIRNMYSSSGFKITGSASDVLNSASRQVQQNVSQTNLQNYNSLSNIQNQITQTLAQAGLTRTAGQVQAINIGLQAKYNLSTL